MDHIDISLPRGAIIAGRVVDEFGEPVADAMVSRSASNVQGTRRLMGSGPELDHQRHRRVPGVRAAARPILRLRQLAERHDDDAGQLRRPSGYAATYYPGTSDISNAQRLTVQTGQMLSEINIPLVLTPTSRITGTVTGRDGRPFNNGMIMVVNRNGRSWGTAANGANKSDGTFLRGNVAPGDYVLRTMGRRRAGRRI